MIPAMIEAHLRANHGNYEHHVHAPAPTAQQLAQAEHVSGYRVAKPVVVRLRGDLALAVVSAVDKVNLSVLEEAIGGEAELVPEVDFASRFEPCETGAEPALAVFGVPILVDQALLQAPRIVMPAGTHEDSIVLDTAEWVRCENVQPVANLGGHLH
jgi:Ala-tRNA(Pro) deacylase